MTKACLCYTCDKNYLLATVVSALQARANLSSQLADVVVIVVGGFDDPEGAIARLFSDNKVVLQIAGWNAIDNLGVQFARHFLDRLLNPSYEKIVHIDSDTQIANSLDPLFEVALPSGMLMAAPDPLAIRIHEKGRSWEELRRYFMGIGVAERHVGRYANTGIFGAWRQDLKGFSKEVVRICSQREKPLRFVEQDAVNIAFGDQIQLISMRWNYPSFFSNCGFESVVNPRVYHFMSNPRPWHGSFQPWGRSAHEVYTAIIRREPRLAPYANRISARQAMKYRAQQRIKQMIEHYGWARPDIRARLTQLETEALV